MKFIAKVSSFLLDSAVALLGLSFVGASAQMFANDIRVAKEKKEDKKDENQSA